MKKARYGLLDRYVNRANRLPRGGAYSVADHDVVLADGTVLKVATTLQPAEPGAPSSQ